MRHLPPLPAIRAFEAAARYQSFKQAAHELGVTPTAISHQVRLLEGLLGTQLFIRRTRQVELTKAGKFLYPACRDALDGIADAVAALTRTQEQATVTLSATSSFIMQWLMPRLPDFKTAHPGVELQLHASEEVVPLGTGLADIAVRYGSPATGDESALLFTEVFAPLCSPALVMSLKDDLSRAPLISSRWRRTDAKTPTWDRWCRETGAKSLPAHATLRLDDDIHAAQAAIAGRGIALLSVHMMSREIKEGLLVQPFEHGLKGHGHYVVVPERSRKQKAIGAVQHWLASETAPLRNG